MKIAEVKLWYTLDEINRVLNRWLVKTIILSGFVGLIGFLAGRGCA